MPCLKFLLLLGFVCPLIAVAQRTTRDFEIEMPEEKISGSLYHSIEYIDARADTSNMGIVQLGAFNKKALVVPLIPFDRQLKKLMDVLADVSSGPDTLLFQLRQLSFAEITGAMSEKGYCYLRAALYHKKEDTYRFVDAIDTVLLVKSMDVTKALFRKGSKLIAEFIGKSLSKPSSAEIVYSYADVVHIDSVEKRKLKVYNTDAYTEGVYKTYETFANQAPDYVNMDAVLKNDDLSSVKVQSENGKMEKIKSKDMYAVVHQGKIFVATDYGYYPVEKINDDFLFTGKAKVAASAGDMIAAGMFFGIIGSLIAENSANATFEMKIDHINGGFIRLREVESY
ncbi:MAG: hypothetical protein KF746_19025 [Chitinophagaceae bacterium]|nr:hypothetical protein [Chitinophagaceae bacterium]